MQEITEHADQQRPTPIATRLTGKEMETRGHGSSSDAGQVLQAATRREKGRSGGRLRRRNGHSTPTDRSLATVQGIGRLRVKRGCPVRGSV